MTTFSVKADRSLIPAEGGCRAVRVTLRAPEVIGGRVRPPLSLGLALDCSGSMTGPKLAITQEAAIQALYALAPGDRFTVVAYNDDATVLAPSCAVSSKSMLHAVESIRRLIAEGNTNLGAGWLSGCRHAAEEIDERTLARCLLLTDGLANRGITAPAELVGHASELRRRGVTTSTLGVGDDFDEGLLHRMAEAGGGTFYYAANTAQIRTMVSAEVHHALDTSVREARLWVSSAVDVRATSLNDDPAWHDGKRTCVELGSLRAGEERTSLLSLELPPGSEGTQVSVRFKLSDPDGVSNTSDLELTFTRALAQACEQEPRDVEITREAVRLQIASAKVRALAAGRGGDFLEAERILTEQLERVRAVAGRDPVLLSLARELAAEKAQYEKPMLSPTGKHLHYSAYASMKGAMLASLGSASSSTIVLRWVEPALAPAVELAKKVLEPHAAASGVVLRVDAPPPRIPKDAILSVHEEQLLVRMVKSPPALTIMFTTTRHYDNWFSHWHQEERVVLVSLHDWGSMSAVPAAALIAYEGLLHGLRAVAPTYDPLHLMHQDTRGCLFDFCQEKPEVEIKLQAGHVCNECLQRLASLGFDTDLVTRAWSAVQQLAFAEPARLHP